MNVISFQAVEGMLDGLTSVPNDPELMIRYRDIHLRVLKALQDPRAYGVQWTNKQVTRCVSVISLMLNIMVPQWRFRCSKEVFYYILQMFDGVSGRVQI